MDLILRLLQDIFLIGVLFPIGVVVYSVFEVIIDYIKNGKRMLIDLPFIIHETVQTVALIYILTVLLKDFK